MALSCEAVPDEGIDHTARDESSVDEHELQQQDQGDDSAHEDCTDDRDDDTSEDEDEDDDDDEDRSDDDDEMNFDDLEAAIIEDEEDQRRLAMASRRGRRSALTPSQQLIQQWALLTKTTSASSAAAQSPAAAAASPRGGNDGSKGRGVSSARLAAQLRNLKAEIDSPKALLSALESPTPKARVQALRDEEARQRAELDAQASVDAVAPSVEAQGEPVGATRFRKATALPPEVGQAAAEVGQDLAAVAKAESQELRKHMLLDEMRRGVVLYDYHRTWKSTVDVRKGERITILDVSSDPSNKWWLVKSEHGAQGWLPKQFIRHRPWANPAHISTVTAAFESTGGVP
jgi:hypothetical protein